MASQPSEKQHGESAEQKKAYPPNNIFIGKKPLMVYALSAQLQISSYTEVILRARGRAISRAVDVAEVLVNRIGKDVYKVDKISIGTEEVGEGDQKRNVSTIEIVVKKKQ